MSTTQPDSGKEGSRPRARVFQSPKYIQQPGCLSHIGEFVSSTFPHLKKAALITSARLKKQYWEQQLSKSIIDPVLLEFSGECSRSNAAQLLAQLTDKGVDHVIGFGGGKLLDIAKMVAHSLRVPMVMVPSLASTDAPCLAVSIVYNDQGEYDSCDFLPHSPDLVIMDPQVVADAPVDYLVAGMGDAMATHYEACACAANPQAYTWMAPLTYRPPVIASAIGEACLKTLYELGPQAKVDCAAHKVTDALEAVVEANTLLSGLGVECGGLAVAHGFHNALTALTETHHAMHGQKVAFGTMVQLMCEGKEEEARRVATFNKTVGLPVTLSDLHVTLTEPKLELLVAKTLEKGSISWNLGPHLTPELVREAIQRADKLGASLAGS